MSEYLIPIESFSTTPGGRWRRTGPFSGEEFRINVLEDALKKHDVVRIDLRAARVTLPSFIDESVGPFVEEFGEAEFRRRVKFAFRPNSDQEFNLEETIRLRLESAGSK